MAVCALALLFGNLKGWEYKLLLHAVFPTGPHVRPCFSGRTTSRLSAAPKRRMFSAGSPRMSGSLPETPTKGGTFLEQNIADIYVILDARGQAPLVRMRWTGA